MSEEDKAIEIRDQVLYLWEKYPKTKNDDLLLQLLYLKIFEKIEIPFNQWENFRKIANTFTKLLGVEDKPKIIPEHDLNRTRRFYITYAKERGETKT